MQLIHEISLISFYLKLLNHFIQKDELLRIDITTCMIPTKRFGISLLYLILLFHYSHGQGNIVLSAVPKTASITHQVSYFKTDFNYSIEEVRKLPDTNWFQIEEGAILNNGYTLSSVWVKIPIVADNDDYKKWVLHLDYHILDTVQLFFENTTEPISLGRAYPFLLNNEHHYAGYSYSLAGLHMGENVLYLKVNSKGPFVIPIALSEVNAFYQASENKHIYYGIYLGSLLVMIFYNLFIFISFRDINYLYYVLTIICTVGIFMTVAGYTHKYILQDQALVNAYFTRTCMGLVVITTAVFARSFLNTKKYAVLPDKLLKISSILAIIAMVLVVTNIKPSATNTLVSLHAPLLLIAGIVAWRNGNRYARFYVFAWCAYLIGGFLITLRNAGVLPLNLVTTHGAEIGSVIEVILLGLALSDRYRVIKMEKAQLVKRNLAIQRKHNEELENKVKLRTADLTEANEELRQVNEELNTTIEKVQEQHEEIKAQKIRVEEKSVALELAYKNIQGSLAYAKRIQDAKLPKLETIQSHFPNSFIYFKPRDIVSGDFYWFTQLDGKCLIAVADCTGHGVPGAFMSMIGSELLNEIVMQRHETNPDKILLLLHEGIRHTLNQRKTANSDGIDLGICCIDQVNKKLTYAGAKTPLIYIQEKQLFKIKGDRLSVGGVLRRQNKQFTLHTLNVSVPTTIYLFSDGIQDQFGGLEGKKFMNKQLCELLLNVHTLSPEEQQLQLETTLHNWMNPVDRKVEKQLDDMLLIGMQI